MNTFAALRCSLRRWQRLAEEVAATITDAERLMASGSEPIDVERCRVNLHRSRAFARLMQEFLDDPTPERYQAVCQANQDMTAFLTSRDA